MFYPPDPAGFNALVWEIVRQIPAGCVSTYGQIASMIPPPDGVDPLYYNHVAARWVGQAMNAVPPKSDVPWQRVINSQGTISLPKGSTGADEQRALLEMEGVVFDKQGRVDFESVGWDGPAQAWLHEHRLLPPRPLKRKKTIGDASQLNLF
jgi:methylated-DNA-protein-cysteine methyltransferase-like protein